MMCCRACENLLDLWEQGERHMPRLLQATGLSASALDKRLRVHDHADHPIARLMANERTR